MSKICEYCGCIIQEYMEIIPNYLKVTLPSFDSGHVESADVIRTPGEMKAVLCDGDEESILSPFVELKYRLDNKLPDTEEETAMIKLLQDEGYLPKPVEDVLPPVEKITNTIYVEPVSITLSSIAKHYANKLINFVRGIFCHRMDKDKS